ncbi:hypothetical protein [Denitratisoma sp. DHT3]|uniref:hypothetical protein n=1 Tax=Denitratisoma sp. DHT3 TaxID=1981880 RepID=UPI0016453110|nr:hypothetical protein [Denitratisoma sp. DHT3]
MTIGARFSFVENGNARLPPPIAATECRGNTTIVNFNSIPLLIKRLKKNTGPADG